MAWETDESYEESVDKSRRLWCIEYAVNSVKKGSTSASILKRAKEFYGFVNPKNGTLTEVKKK